MINVEELLGKNLAPEEKENQFLDLEILPTESKVLDEKPLGQHCILDVVADSYDKVLELCSGLGYNKILKVKRLPYHTHATTCRSLVPDHGQPIATCNCSYVNSKELTRPMPAMNRWKVTVMALMTSL